MWLFVLLILVLVAVDQIRRVCVCGVFFSTAFAFCFYYDFVDFFVTCRSTYLVLIQGFNVNWPFLCMPVYVCECEHDMNAEHKCIFVMFPLKFSCACVWICVCV